MAKDKIVDIDMKLLALLLITTFIMIGLFVNLHRTERMLNELHNEHCVLLEKINKMAVKDTH